MKIRLAAALLALALAACDDPPAPHERLNGTWTSNIATAQFDFAAGVYKGVSLGEPFDKKLKLVEEMGNSVVFMSDDTRITAQLQDDGSVVLMKEGGLPVRLTRAP